MRGRARMQSGGESMQSMQSMLASAPPSLRLFRVRGLRLRVEGLGFRVQALEFRLSASGFRVEGLGFRVWGLEVFFASLPRILCPCFPSLRTSLARYARPACQRHPLPSAFLLDYCSTYFTTLRHRQDSTH